MEWYVIHTKPRFEKKVAASLEAKGYTVYLPLRKVLKQWSDRKKKVQEPLIKSYVFIQTEEHLRDQALLTPGVVRFLFWLGKPAIVLPGEIEGMRRFLGELDYVPEKHWEYLEYGDNVQIKEGIFKHQQGTFIARQGNKLLLNVQSLGQLIKVEIPLYYASSEKLK